MIAIPAHDSVLVMRSVKLVVVLLLVARTATMAQCDGKPGPDGLSWNFDESDRGGFSIPRFIGDIFTPALIKDTREIRAYVRDERFALLLERCGDMRAVDWIYLKALRIAEHDIGRALFLSMMATLEHRNIDLKVPVVGALRLPLTFEEDSLFNSRYRNLPSRLYADTPRGSEGDKDKLQHFFASAYLAYLSESPSLARTSGELVERGEAEFVVGGVDDPRDRRANDQGTRFGRDLVVVHTLLPSDYFNLSVDE
jgi:hypothetical protein